MRVCVLPEDSARALPRHVAAGDAYWPAWAARPHDARWLAERVRGACVALLPAVSTYAGSPAELSYWLASNLPLGCRSRLRLLAAPSPAARLRLELALLQHMQAVRCMACHHSVARPSDAVPMTEQVRRARTALQAMRWAALQSQAARMRGRSGEGPRVQVVRGEAEKAPELRWPKKKGGKVPGFRLSEEEGQGFRVQVVWGGGGKGGMGDAVVS
eukprot:366496-Chlamydomonas_euryale.AAC.33